MSMSPGSTKALRRSTTRTSSPNAEAIGVAIAHFLDHAILDDDGLRGTRAFARHRQQFAGMDERGLRMGDGAARDQRKHSDMSESANNHSDSPT